MTTTTDLKIESITTHQRRLRNRPDRYDRKEYFQATRVYFSVADESIWDNLANRRRRPYNEYKALMPEVLRQLGAPEGVTYRWSKNAGCAMCSCSPGLVLDRRLLDDGIGYDVWVTITGEEHPADYNPARIAQQVMDLEIVEVPR